MYNQTNYDAQYGQGGFRAPMPQFQQRPPLPPPPSHFQQGPPVPLPHSVDHSGPPQYHHVPPRPVQQGPPVQVHTNRPIFPGQPYLPPPPPPPQQIHGNTTLVHSYSSAQPNSHWSHSVHHAPSAASPASSTEPNPPVLFHPSLPPRILPPLPTQGQSPYSGHIHLPQAGGLQGAQHFSLPPPPPPPSIGPMPPPNPPSSPPPPPPSPPPTSPYSSAETLPDVPSVATSNKFCDSEPGPTSGDSGFEIRGSDSDANALVSTQNIDDAPSLRDKSSACLTSFGGRSPVRDDSSTVEGRKFDLLSPPKKHAEEEVDSDMDMEDDITQPEEKQVYASSRGSDHEIVSKPEETENLPQNPVVQNTGEECPGNDPAYDLSGLAGKDEDDDHFTYEGSIPKVGSSLVDSAGAAECPSNINVQKPAVTPPVSLDQFKSSEAAAGIGSEKLSGELAKDTSSSFRLLQDYASDDDSGDDEKAFPENGSGLAASPTTAAAVTSSHGDVGSNLLTSVGPKGLSGPDIVFGKVSESTEECPQSMPLGAPDVYSSPPRMDVEPIIACSRTIKTEEPSEKNYENVKATANSSPDECLQQKYGLDGFHDLVPEVDKSQSRQEDGKLKPVQNVDEFGRLIRERTNDSDSDESPNTGRRSKRRRSWSRSRSPHDRRRNPSRRKEKRSRSRSWSPRKRRSRSRSPIYRRVGDSGGDRMKRDKGQLQQCFDFLRGRCYRGASCRYMHQDSDRPAKSYRSRERHSEARNTDFHDDVGDKPSRKAAYEHDKLGASFSALSDVGKMDENSSLVSQKNDEQALISAQYDKSLVAKAAESETSTEAPATLQQTQDSREDMSYSVTGQPNNISSSCLLTSDGGPAIAGNLSHGVASSLDNFAVQHSPVNISPSVTEHANHQPQQVDDTSICDSSQQVHASLTFQKHLLDGHDRPSNQRSPDPSSITQLAPTQALHANNFPTDTSSALGLSGYQLQSTVLPLVSGSVSAPPPPEVSRESNSVQLHSSLSPREENGPPKEGSLQNQNSHFAVPPNTSWSLPLPPPPPRPLPPRPIFANDPFGIQGVPLSQFQQNQLPARNESASQTFARPYPPEIPAHARPGEFQRSSHHVVPVHESSQHPQNIDYLRPRTQPMSNTMGQPYGAIDLGSEDRLSRFQVPNLYSTHSFSHGNVPPESVPPLGDLAPRRPQSFPGDNLSSAGIFSSFPHNQPYLQQQPHVVRPPPPYLQQQQQAPYDMQPAASSGLSSDQGNHGIIHSSLSSYTSSYDQNNPSHLSSFGGSRIPSHYNPYASTFDQPLTSKFSSISFKPETNLPYINQHDAPHNLSHDPIHGHGGGNLDSKLMVSSPKTARAAGSRGDQYDPLFDSMEPSSNSVRKSDKGQKSEPTNESMTLKLGVSRKSLDMEENSKQKDVGIVADSSSVKSESDQYGETADAEVGDVDNASGSNQFDAENLAAGDIEIDQVKTPGKKSKKSKSSRSTKLFKVALADFVKEELKPFWRQGNMSKEAFKTIVKKTVDKVSGAMKSNQVPKSQTKINQYIDSSQRKLTKLVMGYVQKYVNM